MLGETLTPPPDMEKGAERGCRSVAEKVSSGAAVPRQHSHLE